MMGMRRPSSRACNIERTTWGTTCSGVTRLMLCTRPVNLLDYHVPAASHVLTCFLKLHVPLRQLFRCEIEAIPLVGNVMVLAEHTAGSNQ
jgi:hypothetical protein